MYSLNICLNVKRFKKYFISTHEIRTQTIFFLNFKTFHCFYANYKNKIVFVVVS